MSSRLSLGCSGLHRGIARESVERGVTRFGRRLQVPFPDAFGKRRLPSIQYGPRDAFDRINHGQRASVHAEGYSSGSDRVVKALANTARYRGRHFRIFGCFSLLQNGLVPKLPGTIREVNRLAKKGAEVVDWRVRFFESSPADVDDVGEEFAVCFGFGHEFEDQKFMKSQRSEAFEILGEGAWLSLLRSREKILIYSSVCHVGRPTIQRLAPGLLRTFGLGIW